MNKKLIIAVVAVVAVLVVGLAVLFGVMNKPKELNLEELNTTFAESESFKEMMAADVEAELLASLMNINTENVEQVVGKFPMMNVHASMYMIIKAKEGTVETVKTEVETYATSYEEQWERYLPEQYELVKNRKLGVYGDYVYLIISENAEELEALIK